MGFHSLTGFCIACGAAYCMKRSEIEHISSELYKKTGSIYGSGLIDLDFLNSEYNKYVKKDNFSFPLNIGLSINKKCTCGNGYNMFCPKHGINSK
jgi:hypothetical protein